MNVSQYWNLYFSPLILYLNYLSRKKKIHSSPNLSYDQPSIFEYLNSIFKSRDIMAFPVVMYGCESWTTEYTECRRIDAFEVWCWRRLLRIPWIARRSNQSILKEINPEYSLEELMLNLNLQHFDHQM